MLIEIVLSRDTRPAVKISGEKEKKLAKSSFAFTQRESIYINRDSIVFVVVVVVVVCFYPLPKDKFQTLPN